MKSSFRLVLLWTLCLLIAACAGESTHEIPVTVIPVSEISLSPSMLLLEEGETGVLKATVLPEDATDKQVVWESDNERVVSVDQNGNLSAGIAGQAVVSATSADGNTRATCTVIVSEKKDEGTLAKRTVLAYIAADNNLASYASEDLKEMKTGMEAITDSEMHLLVYIDTGTSPRLIELINTDGTVSEVTVQSYGSRNSAGVEEMRQVFDDVFQSSRYKAESYGLVFWSHAEGWIPYPQPSTRWIGQDKGEGDNRMNLSDFKSLLSSSAPHFDFILFDACFMQSIEVAYELRGLADYSIASPTETPGTGAPYDRILPYMFIQGAAAELAQTYFEAYEAIYDEGWGITNDNWTGGASIAAVDLNALEALTGATRQLLSTATAIDPQILRPLVFDYDKRPSGSHVGYYDLKEMMNCLTIDGEVYAAWEAAFDAALAYWNTTPMNYSSSVQDKSSSSHMFSMERANGITHYIPSSLTAAALESYRSLEWYEDAGLGQIGW